MGKGISRLFVFASVLAALGFSLTPRMPTLLAGSMHWFELETSSICTPSPVNRLVRPSVCLGFEKSLPLLASR